MTTEKVTHLLNELRQMERMIGRLINTIVENCEHEIINTAPDKLWGVAKCKWCDKEFGWYCPNSEDHLCCYENGEYCKHCHQPWERK